nr:hypothetical protein [uncultured Rhodoferax sp.]
MNTRQGLHRINTEEETNQPWDTLNRVLDVCFGVLLGLASFPALMWLGSLFYTP